jgi:hypothetical protein
MSLACCAGSLGGGEGGVYLVAEPSECADEAGEDDERDEGSEYAHDEYLSLSLSFYSVKGVRRVVLCCAESGMDEG